MKKLQHNAVTLSWILSIAVGLSVATIFVGDWLLKNELTSRVTELRNLEQEASQNYDNQERAKALKIFIDMDKESIDKASSIVADTKTYQYQNQVVNDVTAFANSAGVTILGFDFPLKTGSTKKASGVKSIKADITLARPVEYNRFITFIKRIEQNLTRMQITSVNITPDRELAGHIANPTVSLEVYVK